MVRTQPARTIMAVMVIMLAMMVISTAPAHATTDGPTKKTILQITPYLWAAQMKGKVSPFKRTPDIHVEKSFKDIMEDLELAGFLNIWGRHGNFVLSSDIMYVGLRDSRTIGPAPSTPLPIPAGTIIKGRADTRQFTASLQGGYRLADRNNYSLDILAGFNYWYVFNRLKLQAGSGAAAASFWHEEDFGWIDPIIGARGFIGLSDTLSLHAQAHIGGFDVGAKHSWTVLGTVNYTLSDSFSASAGYKVLDVDYHDRGHVYDTRLSGPVIGVTWRF